VALKQNSFRGVSSGTALTTGNSGGVSGDAFDAVEITGTGGPTVTVSTAADLTDAYPVGIVCNVGAANGVARARWNVTSSTDGYIRFYFRSHSAVPATSIRLVSAMATTTVRWQVRMRDPGGAGGSGKLELTDGAGAVIRVTTADLAVSTIYRCEVKIVADDAGCEMRVYAGESMTPLAVTSFAGADIAAWDRITFGYTAGTLVTWDPNIAAVAWADSAHGWIGPARNPSGAITTPAITTSGAATLVKNLSGNATIPAVVADGDATARASASGAVTIPAVVAEGAAEITFPEESEFSGDVTIPAVTAEGEALAQIVGTGSVAIPAVVASGAFTPLLTIDESDIVIPAVTAEGAVAVTLYAFGAITTPAVTVAATIGGAGNLAGAITTPAVVASGSATIAAEASGAVTLPSVQASGTVAASAVLAGAVTIPAVTVTGQAIRFTPYHVTSVRVGAPRVKHSTGAPRGTMTVGTAIS
jgi:hypothetical protein